jgi:two-component system capsular synthesis response regulator RcsB
MYPSLNGLNGQRILLADDHPLCIMGTEQLIVENGLGSVICRVASPEQLIDRLSAERIDLVVTDYCMPSKKFGDGLQLLRYIKSHYPDLPVVVLTMISNPAVLISIWNAEVAALVSKNSTVHELVQAIQTAASGRRCAAALVRAQIGLDTWVNAESDLSPRESEVLRLFSEGLTGNEIANHLCRSKKTVSRQKISGMRKLGVTKDADFFVYEKSHADCFRRRLYRDKESEVPFPRERLAKGR